MSQNMVFFGRFMTAQSPHTQVIFYVNDNDRAFVVGPDGAVRPLGSDSLSLSEMLGVEIPAGIQTQTSSVGGRHLFRLALAWAECNPQAVKIVTRPVPYIVADWDGADANFTSLGSHDVELSGWDFSRVNFKGADFRRTTLTDVKFKNVEGARFEGAELRNVDATGANLSKANFTGATIIGGSFAGANLTGAVFGGASPATFRENVDFTGANLELANFTGTSLMPGEVTMGRPRFGTSVDRRTILARTRVHTGFLGRDWSCLDCAGATIVFDPDFDSDELVANFAILTGVNFAGRSLAGAQFQSAVLHGAHFANCNLEDASFQGAILGGSGAGTAADFSGARLGLANFSDADLSGVGFSGASLKGAKFTNALLLTTDFSNAFVADADFIAIRDRRMQGVSFNNACLVSASFRGTTVTRGDSGRPTSFTGAILLGADFTGATLAEATLTNAKLASRPGTITAILAPRGDEPPETIVMTYEATQLRPEATGPHTRCPDGAGGPCSRERLITPSVPDTWRQPGARSIPSDPQR
jgi:uncharacterized protein YjbI with pentapeptide repeats